MALDAKLDDHAPPPVRPNGPSVAPHERAVTQKATKIRASCRFSINDFGDRDRSSRQSDPRNHRASCSIVGSVSMHAKTMPVDPIR
jgi:hypothetical protein